jgi:hypothetical protein
MGLKRPNRISDQWGATLMRSPAPEDRSGVSETDELVQLEIKIGQLKQEYEQYFLGTRPREPLQARAAVDKIIARRMSLPSQNTAERFKFSSLCQRLQTHKRQWSETLRKMEAGTYQRHRFKAHLHEKERPSAPASPVRNDQAADAPDLFNVYVEAARSCGQDVSKLTRKQLGSVVEKQSKALRKKLGCDQVDFKVIVRDGKVKLKASSAGSE